MGVAGLVAPASFLAECAGYEIGFDEGDLERLGKYLALLLEASKAFNLTSVTGAEEAWRRHIFDSLTLLPLLEDVPDGGAVADVGSGGGLPGVVLAICMPHLEFTLIEATGKKAEFLRIVKGELGLKNVRVVNDRAEALGADGARHRGMYDAVVARAVVAVAVIAELCVPLAANPKGRGGAGTAPGDEPGGQVLLIKGQKAPEEMAEAKQALHMLHVSHVGTVETPTGRIVVLEKMRPTPAKYPRKSGEPKRAPLGG